jgi:hypothetical protein
MPGGENMEFLPVEVTKENTPVQQSTSQLRQHRYDIAKEHLKMKQVLSDNSLEQPLIDHHYE